MSLRSPFSRLLGQRSANEGTEHWWIQRVTSVALLLLGAWFLIRVRGVVSFQEADLYAWVAYPLNALMLLLLSVTLVWHSMLGVQVVIEDYVHGPAIKVVSLTFNKFAHVFFGLAAVFPVLTVSLGGSG